ncbi:MAG: DUF1289 domain-containing protein [Novosphingobium sp. 28-62-57]|nr:MAG: DUF1289 domain-containing protein [Novosphingobium sp. 28-62-57]
MKDPCISVCQFERRTGWCAGCGRTIPEVRSWRKMQPQARGAVERDLPRRMKRLADRDAKVARSCTGRSRCSRPILSEVP